MKPFFLKRKPNFYTNKLDGIVFRQCEPRQNKDQQ